MLRMPEKPVISNTSPLVCLWGLDLLYLLRELYTEVWIPEEVAKEFSATALTDRQAALDNSPWIRTVRLRKSLSKPSISGIDAGEAAVLALAEEYPPQIILLDDLDARRYAKSIGLPVSRHGWHSDNRKRKRFNQCDQTAFNRVTGEGSTFQCITHQ